MPKPLLGCVAGAAKKVVLPLRAGGGTVVAPLTLGPRLGRDGDFEFDSPGADDAPLEADPEAPSGEGGTEDRPAGAQGPTD